MSDPANGRMTKAAAEEYSESLGQIGAGWWRQVLWAEQRGIPATLGLQTKSWVLKYVGGYVKMLPAERRKAIAELTEAGMSGRKIADVLGVSHETVRRDTTGTNVPLSEPEPTKETKKDEPAGTNVPPHRTIEIRRMDYRELLGSLTAVDAIITDPPYERSAIPLYGDLARLAKGCLKPDGILAVMCGQSYLPEILPVMAAILPYRWTMAYLTFGAHTKLWQRNIFSGWKPIVLFGAAGKSIFDVVTSDGRDKRYHEWGQSESGMAMLVEAVTDPGSLVVDPFAGGNTTGVVCEKLGRRFIGGDVNAPCH